MKAIIFNSGLGKRMQSLTENCHKSMVTLKNGESIFERQIRLLSEGGIREFVITSGPHEEQLIAVTKKDAYKNLRFHFVRNPIYDKTNYIYSFYLARHLIDDDFLMLHGDLVFDKEIVKYVIDAPFHSVCMINKALPKPEKDFKGRIIDGRLREVSISIFDEDCFTFQPFYKLSRETVSAWVKSVVDFIENKKIDGVYAENALNAISDTLDIRPLSYEEHYLEEIDNVEDYHRVRDGIELFDYREQEITVGADGLFEKMDRLELQKPLVILDSFMRGSELVSRIEKAYKPALFSDFLPNPTYEQAIAALEVYKNMGCDSIISIGGGSAIDVGKAVKYYSSVKAEIPFAKTAEYVNLKHFAIPTTAGTGSESTRFAVIYYNGEKQSLTHSMLLPDLAVLIPELLSTLPYAQKRSTVLDALCQATESAWAHNTTDEAKAYAKEAIGLILKNIKAYMRGDNGANPSIMRAASLAGRAINITTTTAAHAMSYKLTSIFKIPHGEAVALCMLPVWDFYNAYALSNNDEKIKRDCAFLCECYNTETVNDALAKFTDICRELGIIREIECTKDEFSHLCENVNTERLSNFPVPLNKNDIVNMYSQFIKVK